MTLIITSALEGLGDRLAVCTAIGEFSLAVEVIVPNGFLVPLEHADQGEFGDGSGSASLASSK